MQWRMWVPIRGSSGHAYFLVSLPQVARVETCSVTGMPHDRMRLHMVEEQMRKAACDEVYRQSMREAGEWIMGGGPGTE